MGFYFWIKLIALNLHLLIRNLTQIMIYFQIFSSFLKHFSKLYNSYCYIDWLILFIVYIYIR